MSSVQHLREFIRERLTAAAEEIFTEVEKTIVRYEEDIRLLEICRKPQIKILRVELQKPHVSTEEKAQTVQQLCNQGRRSSQDQKEVEPQWTEDDPPIKELGEPGHPWIKEEEEDPTLPLMKEENEEEKEPGMQLMEEQDEPRPQWKNKEEEEIASPLFELKRNPDSSVHKHKHLLLEHSPPGQEEEQPVALMETFTIQEEDQSETKPRIDQFYISTVVETKDQRQSTFNVSESQFQIYTKIGSLNCDICGRSFKRRYNMKRHYTSHTGEKPFLCQTCGKGFSTMCSLEYHIRTHTGEKPFPCHICKKGFSSMSNLKGHIRTHTGERPFSCETCGKRFSKVYNLNVHIRTHTS